MSKRALQPIAKFIRIISGERSLNALDDQGDVWVYAGSTKGWARLNMTRVEDAVKRQSFEPQLKGSNIPSGWESNNDIPF